jgi:hypothetical protein
VFHACLRYKTVAIQKYFMGIALPIKEMPSKSTPVIGSTHCINKAILCSGTNGVHHASEVLNILER